MKIGILTFHRSRNYGAVLQAYGLTKTIKEIENDIEIIDYVCVPIENTLRLWIPNKNIIRSLKQFVFRFQKKKAFKSFIRKWLPVTNKRNIKKETLPEELKKYDCIIAGSDQIWNTKLTNNDEVYFLDIPEVRAKRISYAGSTGDYIYLNEKNIESLKAFQNISVREMKLKSYLNQNKINATLCCDPALLLTCSDYLKIKSKQLSKHKYIFLFMIWESDELIYLAQKYAQENDCIVISNKKCLKFFLHCKPEDFLSWIYHADCVLTNSFHGTVFSLLFHKLFISDISRPNGEVNERIQDILKAVNCMECILTDKAKREGIQFNCVDFNEIDKRLSVLRNHSLEWLRQTLMTQRSVKNL